MGVYAFLRLVSCQGPLRVEYLDPSKNVILNAIAGYMRMKTGIL